MNNIYLASRLHRVTQDIADKLTADGFHGRRLCFIITASEQDTDDLEWRDNDRNALVAAGFKVEDYTFTGHTKEEIAQHLQQLDLKGALVQLIKQGKVYLGCSAGSIVAGPDIYPLRHTEELPVNTQLDNYTGLNLINTTILPHWGSEYFKDLYLNKRLEIAYSEQYKLMLLTDNQYVTTSTNSSDTINFRDITKN